MKEEEEEGRREKAIMVAKIEGRTHTQKVKLIITFLLRKKKRKVERNRERDKEKERGGVRRVGVNAFGGRSKCSLCLLCVYIYTTIVAHTAL